MITISISQLVGDLIDAIKGKLELKDVFLSLYQVHPRSIQEMKIDSALNFLVDNLRQNSFMSQYIPVNNLQYYIAIFSQFLCIVS